MSDWSSEVFIKRIGPLVTIAPELLGIFVSSLEEKVLQLQSPTTLEQIPLIHNIAHSIKGSAGQVSCTKLANYALALEGAAKLGSQEHIHIAVRQLVAQVYIDIDRIKAFLATMESV